MDNYRRFTATDPFGREWTAEFQWQQTAISIRHADTVDVKWRIATEGERADKVIALPHALLLAESSRSGRELTDPWCMKLAATHLKHMIETFEDMDKTLVTLNSAELSAAAKQVAEREAELREEALLA
jgi:hypothetical protein